MKKAKAAKKVAKVMREFKGGTLHSGKKGPVVKNKKQAIAIALSEANAHSNDYKPTKTTGIKISLKRSFKFCSSAFIESTKLRHIYFITYAGKAIYFWFKDKIL